MDSETSATIRIRELEERLKAEQNKTAQLEKELAEKKEATEFWESHESHIQYQKDLQRFMTPGEVERGDLQKHAEKLLNDQIWITQSYYEVYNKWEKEKRVHKECRRKVSELMDESHQLGKEVQQSGEIRKLMEYELEEVRDCSIWFEQENKSMWKTLESCREAFKHLKTELTKIPGTEELVVRIDEQLSIIRGDRPPPPGPSSS